MNTSPLTTYPELDRVLVNHAEELKQVLGSNFVGYYLTGSLAIGDFDLTSDVDFIVVTDRRLSLSEVEGVQEIHLRISSQQTRWVRHLEYSFFPKPMLLKNSSRYTDRGPNTDEGRDLCHYVNGSKTMVMSGHDNTLVTRWTLREKQLAVLGPRPETFMPRIEPNDLRREIRDDLVNWGQEVEFFRSTHYNRFHQAFFVLNSCRCLQDLNEGRVTSKREGVEWARSHLDATWMPLVNFCWQERQDTRISVHQPADPEIFRQSMELVQYSAQLARDYPLKS